mmetsp:Transcript_1284/g.2088  ORF Transcript_1284/g.2088 Transcript_1284/m.2088 type:complete len:216 (+) Transcript_1284:124-771(+)
MKLNVITHILNRTKPTAIFLRHLSNSCRENQNTSKRPAAPIPPPTHMVTTTLLAPRRLPSRRMWPTCLDPVMPNGWPIDIAPPFTFILLWSIPSTSAHRSGTTAKASLSSQRSMSSTLRPWRDSSLGTATVGPIPISSGSQPPTANPTKAPSGSNPRLCASASSMSRHADAPSDNWDALPAVIVALGSASARTGTRPCISAKVVPGRLHSSLETV